MALKIVDTSTNWTNAEWRKIDRLRSVLAEGDNRSGRPWVIGTLVNDIAPIIRHGSGSEAYLARNSETLRDLAAEVGETTEDLSRFGHIAIAWPESDRVAGVHYSVFRVLYADPDRKRILAQLLKEKKPFDITKDDARRLIGKSLNAPRGLKEYVGNWETTLNRFMNQRLYSADRLALQKLRLKIDILLGDAEEEAV
jgi:hypothetical protein